MVVDSGAVNGADTFRMASDPIGVIGLDFALHRVFVLTRLLEKNALFDRIASPAKQAATPGVPSHSLIWKCHSGLP